MYPPIGPCGARQTSSSFIWFAQTGELPSANPALRPLDIAAAGSLYGRRDPS